MNQRPSFETRLGAAVVLVAILTVGWSGWPHLADAASAEPASGRERAVVAARPPLAHAATGVERLTATVHAVDARAGTVDLVTGVGMALRMRRVHLPARLMVKVDRTEAPVSVLTPGCIVRMDCQHGPGGTIAYTV